jgi:hypothetical protein
MARTLARQLPRALALAKSSNRDGSPRALTGRSAHAAALAPTGAPKARSALVIGTSSRMDKPSTFGRTPRAATARGRLRAKPTQRSGAAQGTRVDPSGIRFPDRRFCRTKTRRLPHTRCRRAPSSRAKTAGCSLPAPPRSTPRVTRKRCRPCPTSCGDCISRGARLRRETYAP